MKLKELKKILKDYNDDTEIIIGGLTEQIVNYDYGVYKTVNYKERPMEKQDIMNSNYNGEKRIVINFRY